MEATLGKYVTSIVKSYLTPLCYVDEVAVYNTLECIIEASRINVLYINKVTLHHMITHVINVHLRNVIDAYGEDIVSQIAEDPLSLYAAEIINSITYDIIRDYDIAPAIEDKINATAARALMNLLSITLHTTLALMYI